MEFRTFFAQDESGNTVSGASVYVYEEGTTNLEIVYDKLGNQIANPLTTDATGKVQFAMDDGIYDLFVDAGSRTYSSVVQFLDVNDSVQEIQTSLNSAQTAATQANNSQMDAQNSASAAATSETNAAQSYNNTLVLFEDFDTRYLGAKSSPPTQDNSGNPLIDGALYWDTTALQLYAWDTNTTQWLSPLDSNLESRLLSNDPNEGASLVGVEGGGTVQDAIDSYGTMAERDITISQSGPSGGSDGDIWIQYVD